MDEVRKQQLLSILNLAKESVENDQELSFDYAKVLFPPERREYELNYYGKESYEQIVSKTYAAPLQEDRLFGEKEGTWVNKLIFGDNLQVLKTLSEMKTNGKLKNSDGSDGVRLVYIDPPFASKQDFENDEKAYSDKLKGAEFLEWLRKRLIMIREVLSDDGAVFVHLDWHKAHYIKVLLDEVFGEANFRNEIIWHYGTYVGNTKKNFPRKHDSIFVYGKTREKRVFYPQHDEKPEADANYKRWSTYLNENNEITGANYPEDDSKFDGYVKRFIRENGRKPKADDVLLHIEGKLVDSVWEIKSVNPMAAERLEYPTQKPEELLERIIASSSNEGDIVLDCFGGSGTTAAVAEKMNRRWITCDIGKLSIYTIQKRMLCMGTYRCFAVYNAGLYDNKKLEDFDEKQWKEFALSLWNVEPIKKISRGITFDGIKNGSYVKVFSPQELNEIGGYITEDTIQELYDRIGTSAGREIFIIAPRGRVAFASDELNGDGFWDVTFYILRIPNSMTEKLTDDFTAQIQASDNASVNDAIDAIGFDFIRPPKVKYEIHNRILEMISFNSEARMKGRYQYQGFEAFSMLLVDYDYNGEVFNVCDVFFHDDFRDHKVSLMENIPGKQMMLIFVDKYGNEFKTTYMEELNV